MGKLMVGCVHVYIGYIRLIDDDTAISWFYCQRNTEPYFFHLRGNQLHTQVRYFKGRVSTFISKIVDLQDKTQTLHYIVAYSFLNNEGKLF